MEFQHQRRVPLKNIRWGTEKEVWPWWGKDELFVLLRGGLNNAVESLCFEAGDISESKLKL